MRQHRYRRAAAAWLAAGIWLLGGCGIAAVVEPPLREEHLVYAGTTESDPACRKFREVLSRDGLTLLVNDRTAEVAVRDAAGVYWYSNPQERDSDPVASEENRRAMAAQARIVYSDAAGHMRSMNTYTDAVARGQYRITAEGDTLSVQYTLGEVEEKKLVPVVVERERFERLILQQLDETQKKTIERYYMLVDLPQVQDEAYRRELEVRYPAAGKGPVWVLRSSPPAPQVEEKIHAVVSQTAYTREDLEADAAANGVDSAAETAVFNLTVEYTLREGRLLVTLPGDRLQMPQSYLIEQVALLEYFGAASVGSDGYLLLPDGSGSLMYFDNGKDGMAPYAVPVYGRDPAVSLSENPYCTAGANLPVFGLKNGETAFLAVIEQGDALANVCAHPSGAAVGCNAAYAAFRVREKAVLSVGSADNVRNIYQQERYSGDFAVGYYFLNGERADYVGMAEVCRRALSIEQTAPVVGERPLYVETVGAIRATENRLGFPVECTRVLTSFGETADLIGELCGMGVSPAALRIRCSGMWQGGMRQGYAASLKTEAALGGDDGFAALCAAAKRLGVSLYPDADLLYVYRNTWGDGYRVGADTARFLTRTRAKVYPHNPATFALDTEAQPRYLISPRRYGDVFAAFGRTLEALPCSGASLRSVGRDLAADYRENAVIDRQTARQRLCAALDSLQGTELMAENGNAYLLPRLSHIVELPTESCGYDICDESVPFLQLVISGSVNYAGKPVNLSSGERRGLLRAVETGAGFLFTVTAAGSDRVRGTDYDGYYACAWSEVRGLLQETRQQAAAADRTAGLRMTDHERLADGVYRTTFADGTRVTVNYNRYPYVGDGIRIEAEAYAVQ